MPSDRAAPPSTLQRSALQFTLGNTPPFVSVLDRINAFMGGCEG